jgi:hypothetical protein
MNSITRKLVLSILTVVLTVVALGTTTFAWFTLTNTAVVQPFQAEITSDTGIEVALGIPVAGEEDELNWVTTLTTAAIQDYIETAYTAFTFTHVTTMNGSVFSTLGTTSMTGTTSGYLSIPVNFRSNSANRILWSTVSLSAGELPWQSDVAFTGAKGDSYIAGDSVGIDASDAFRIAIIGNVAADPSHVVAYENGNTTTNVVLDGDGVAMDLRGTTELVDVEGVPTPTYIGVNGAMNYFYRKNASLPFGADAVTVLDTIQTLAENPVLDLAVSETAGAANYGQLVIRVWLEGWDANAYNSVLGRMITASFVFTGTTI